MRGHHAQGLLPLEMFLAHTAGSTAILLTLSFTREAPGGVGRSPILRKTKFRRYKFARIVSRYWKLTFSETEILSPFCTQCGAFTGMCTPFPGLNS